MLEMLVFHKTNGVFPKRTNDTASGSLDAYKDNPDIKTVEWKPNNDRIASNYKIIGDDVVIYDPPLLPSRPEPTYKDLRRAAYQQAFLDIGDQLDALYKAAVRLGIVPDVDAPPDTPEGWTGRVQAIKDRFPKPE